MNGRVTVMPPKLGQSEVSDSVTGGHRLTIESSPLRISLSWLAQLTLRCEKAFLFFFYFLPARLSRKWRAAVVWLVAILWEQMFKWHQLRAESGRKKKKRGWWIGQQTKGDLPLTPGPTTGRQHIWLEMNKEGRKALGHQQDASSIFTHKASSCR